MAIGYDKGSTIHPIFDQKIMSEPADNVINSFTAANTEPNNHEVVVTLDVKAPFICNRI